MRRRAWFSLLCGGCFFLFCMTFYFSLVSIKYFLERSSSIEKKKQTLYFSSKEDHYSVLIQVHRTDLYYLNWYPKIVLKTKLDFSNEPKIHLSKVNGSKLLHRQGKEETVGKCIFTNSKGVVKIKELNNTINNTFTVGPVTEGVNVIKLYFEPDYDVISDLTCEIIFSETSNIATPWIWLMKAIFSTLLFVIFSFILIRYTKSKS